MKKKKLDLEKLEEAEFKIEKEAFQPRVLHCSKCNVKMKKKYIEFQVGKDFLMRLKGFECPKCEKKYLGLKESRKLDKVMILSRATTNNFKMTRKLSFDGDNYTFRVPKEFTHNVSKRKVEIVPLGARDFFAFVN